MITMFTKFKHLAAAAVTAGLMGLGGAAPAQADSFSFGFSFGNGSGFNSSHSARPYYRDRCMTNRSIARLLGDYGYRHAAYVDESYYGEPRFEAVQGGWVYTMRVDRCSGHISNIRQIRPVHRHRPYRDHWWYDDGPDRVLGRVQRVYPYN